MEFSFKELELLHVIANVSLEQMKVTRGVPQSCILVSHLFNGFILPLVQTSNKINHHYYIDIAQLYITMSLGDYESIHMLSRCFGGKINV